MKKGIWIGCFPPDMSTQARFQLAKEAGFEGIEISGGDDSIGSDAQLDALAELSRRTLPITSIMSGVGWRPSLTDPDPAARAHVIEGFRGRSVPRRDWGRGRYSSCRAS